jgi:hypothetical protein
MMSPTKICIRTWTRAVARTPTRLAPTHPWQALSDVFVFVWTSSAPHRLFSPDCQPWRGPGQAYTGKVIKIVKFFWFHWIGRESASSRRRSRPAQARILRTIIRFLAESGIDAWKRNAIVRRLPGSDYRTCEEPARRMPRSVGDSVRPGGIGRRQSGETPSSRRRWGLCVDRSFGWRAS